MIKCDFVGIDIAKARFDVALKGNNAWIEVQFNNDPKGHKAFLDWLTTRTKTAFVCLEATGSYGERLAEFLVKHEIKVSVVNPMQIKHYAKSLLARNKNDRMDARIIASHAEKFIPRCFVPRTADQKLAKEAVQLIDTLNGQKRQLYNQLESIGSHAIKREMEKTIQWIEKKILKIEGTLNRCIDGNADCSEDKQRLLSIVGVGEKTANRLIAHLPPITGFKNAKQLAAYAGVSPKQHQSGNTTRKTRLSKCGNSRLRQALYMPALVAKNKNPYLNTFCQRLEKNGLQPKQIICAVMRKLIHIIFGLLKHKQDFNPALV